MKTSAAHISTKAVSPAFSSDIKEASKKNRVKNGFGLRHCLNSYVNPRVLVNIWKIIECLKNPVNNRL
jgi:hypothetical protein